jgi:hypothetical protein
LPSDGFVSAARLNYIEVLEVLNSPITLTRRKCVEKIGVKPPLSTLSFVKKLASRTRYAGTEGEKEAYEQISREFEALGCHVEKDETEYIKSEKYGIGINLLVFWIFVVFIGVSWFVHPLTVTLLIGAFFAFTEKILPKITLRLARTKSINVIATINPEKEHRLILCGHYDSSRVTGKFMQKHLKTFMNVIPIMTLFYYTFVIVLFVKGIYTLVIDGFALITLIELTPRMVGLWTVVYGFYFTVYLAVLLIMTGLTSRFFTKKSSFGADDNASGIAVMLETAKRFSGNNLDLRMDFACFTAEERGLFGSRKWVNKHVNEIDRERTFVLNIDCVGRGDRFFLTKGLGNFFKKRSDPFLCEIVTSTFDELKLPFEEEWAGNSDHAEFVEKNFRACAISRCNVEKANIATLILRKMYRIPVKNKVIPYMDWIHTENDTIENIEEKKLEETTNVVVKFVEMLNKRIDDSKATESYPRSG